MNNINDALVHIKNKIEKNFKEMNNFFPDSHTLCGRYPHVSNYLSESGWTTGFWTGMLWMMYEYSKEKKYRLMAEYHLTSFRVRLRENILVDHHDLGFLFLPSAYAQFKITESDKAKETVIWAADKLCERYITPGSYLQAWGEVNLEKDGKFIIDCNLNTPLLFKAFDITKNKKYWDIAVGHLKTAVKNLVRKDGSTFHSFNMKAKTGETLLGETVQGFSDESCWARGQAWAIYGFALAYKRTNDEIFKEAYFKTANYYLKNLPADFIPHWDLFFSNDKNSQEERDTSASAIFACGVLFMNEHFPEQNGELYKAALKTLENLTSKYLTDDESGGILSQAVYNKKLNVGVNESVIWGDFYFVQAILQLSNFNFYNIWE